MSRLVEGKMMRKRSRRLFQKNVLVLFCLMLLFSPFSTVFGGVGEDDSLEEPTRITSLTELNDIRNNLEGNYRLDQDIDLSELDDWKPIGTQDEPFKGIFDGNGFKIIGMNSEFEPEEYDGLFSAVDNKASLLNIIVEYRNEKDGNEGDSLNSEIEEQEVAEEKLEQEKGNTSESLLSKEDTEAKVEKMVGLRNDNQTASAVAFSGGSGKEDDPFLIETVEQLNEIRNTTDDSHFKLIANIDLAGYEWTPISYDYGYYDDDYFKGTFDGNNYYNKQHENQNRT